MLKHDTVSIIVPALNEEVNIKPLVWRIHAALTKRRFEYEVIFIDDHSSDRTYEIIRQLSMDYPVRVEYKKGSPGKAQSLLEGFKLARYEVIAMIDADLQYPPEAIPEMVVQLGDEFQVIQSRRIKSGESFMRKLAHFCFNFFFIRLLHGIKLDTQSGLKVFYKDILDDISINPTPWTFDLEFLKETKNSGRKIGSFDIIFEDRKGGESKVHLIKQAWEIGSNAIKMRFKTSDPVVIPPQTPDTMIGAGMVLNGKRFITHTTLSHKVSAIRTLVSWQKAFLIVAVAAIVAGFVLTPLKMAVGLISVLSLIYFIDVVFNFYLVYRSLETPPEIKTSEYELSNLSDAKLPVYSILCPLYREAHVLPGFLEAIEKLDWPKNRLDVMLLLEEDDKETIFSASSMQLPDYVRIVIVPESFPKTKPKACNYGLSLARGEYLVIYDAEDIPDPLQLKKAYLAFQKVPSQIKCLQAKLNYFNPEQNWQTRMFTAEYSLWFDLVLPGLQSLNTYIPLGGTSNHFRTADLRELKGWDPFNVTEDCDLGARLFKQGATTAVIDSVTLEEANSNFRNWLRQRSRWIKGYMQTYLVHMRRPVEFFRNHGVHAVIFQLVVGGKIAFLLINPLLWLATIAYFALNAYVGESIEALYPPAIFYIGAVSLLFGNFLFLFYYMIGLAKRQQWRLMKFIYLAPVYWLMASVAAVIALYQLIVKPHYWEKTNHGLHLAKTDSAHNQTETIQTEVEPAPVIEEAEEANDSGNQMLSKGSVLLIVFTISNCINFLFNAFLGRVLTFEELGLVTLINTLWYITSLFVNALSTTVNHRVSYLSAKGEISRSRQFLRVVLRRSFIVAALFSAIWLIATPSLTRFFNIVDVSVLFLFTPALTLGVVGYINKGFLQGRLNFTFVAIITLFETLFKFVFALVLVFFNQSDFVFLAIPASVAAAALISILIIKPDSSSQPLKTDAFPVSFFSAAIFSGLATTLFFTLDIILVKHFLSARAAGEYVLLSLVGKMIYFFGALPNTLMVTFVSREVALKRKPRKVLYQLFAATFILVAIGFIALVPFGDTLIPLLLGEKALVILPHVPAYVLAISAFTLYNVIVTYFLARKRYMFPVAALLVSVIMAIGIILNHDTIEAIVDTILSSSLLGLAIILIMYATEPSLVFVKRAILDFLRLFVPLSGKQKPSGAKRILIFNWRDTKHIYAGGAEVYIHEIAKKWVKNGSMVTLFCGSDGKNPPYEIIDGIEIVRRGGFYLVYFWAPLYYLLRFRGRYDVIIDCQNGIPFFTPFYAKEPVFCVVHHIHQEIFRQYLIKPMAWLATFLERDLMPIAYRNTKFITVSESTKRHMESLGMTGTGIEIVHNGVDLKKYKPATKSLNPSVLYLGRLKAYKSVDVLIKAFKKVTEKIPSARLVVAGSGEEAGNLMQLAEDLDLAQKIEFTGRITEEEKIKLFQESWVFVNPSLIEGWGITTIEANACGTAVVASDVPGLRDSVNYPTTGYLAPHGDAEAFSERIIELLENHSVRYAMSREAMVWAKNFGWDKSSRDFYAIITRPQDYALDGVLEEELQD